MFQGYQQSAFCLDIIDGNVRHHVYFIDKCGANRIYIEIGGHLDTVDNNPHWRRTSFHRIPLMRDSIISNTCFWKNYNWDPVLYSICQRASKRYILALDGIIRRALSVGCLWPHILMGINVYLFEHFSGNWAVGIRLCYMR